MRGVVGKETPKKEMDLDVFLRRHTWHFLALTEIKLMNKKRKIFLKTYDPNQMY